DIGGSADVSVTATTLTFHADVDVTATRVGNTTNPIVNTWKIKLGAENFADLVVTFLADGTYYLAEDGISGTEEGQDGMERGIYSWNRETGSFSATAITDTNGEWGLSHANIQTATISGDTLTLVPATGGPFALGRVLLGMAPLIAVEQPTATTMADGGSRSFGSVTVGSDTSLTFTIKNTGAADLTDIAATIDGANALDFSITAAPAPSLSGPSGNTTFTVRFAPTSAGAKTAALHIASNDANENPFDITLNGAGGLMATYNSATDVAIAANGFAAAGTVNFDLNYAPTAGTSLMVVKNTGLDFISGAFDNLAQGQKVALIFNGVSYNFVANYYGGTGNDLVLQWANMGPLLWGRQTFDVRNTRPPFVAIAAGDDHTVALKRDGTVVVWGDGASGQAKVPEGLSGVIAVAAGAEHSVALKGDGTVVAWGADSWGQRTIPTGLVGVTAIAACANHTVALKSDGTVVAWGSDTVGQSTIPSGLSGVIAIAAGGSHTVALTNEGNVVAWGYDAEGQATVPAGLGGVIAIAAGHSHTVALKSDATVAAWGMNDFGQTTVPAGLSGVITMSAGVSHTVAVKSDGTVVGWGRESNGQTTLPPGQSGVYAIAAGPAHNFTLNIDGTVVAWGESLSGQTTVPVGLNAVSAIATSNHTVALKRDGTVVAWGDNTSGKATVPPGLSGVSAIAAGGTHTVALKNDGTMAAWGANNSGQTTVPAGLNGIRAVSAGFMHTVALKSDGTVVAWGRNIEGQTSVPAGLSSVIAISAGHYHTMALKSDGTVVAWGWNLRGQSTVPAGLNGVTAIVAGDLSSAALKSDGTVVVWGATGYSPAVVPAGLSGVGAVARGSSHTMVLVPLPPALTLNPASSLATTNATVSGIVNPNGQVTTAQFEYGLSTSYGSTASVSLTPNDGETEQNVSASLSGLTPNTTYYYRLTATSVSGAATTGYGTFSTVGPSEIAVQQPAGTDITNGGSRILGATAVNTTSEMEFSIRNFGASNLTGLGITIDGTDAGMFNVIAGPAAPVVPNGLATFTVRFTPTTLGAKTATLHIASNDPDENPFDIALNGTGLVSNGAKIVALSPLGAELPDGAGLVYFGGIYPGSEDTREITIRNDGNQQLTGLGILIDGPGSAAYSITQNPVAPVAPGGTTTFILRFTPLTEGIHRASLHIASNDTDIPSLDLQLTGGAIGAVDPDFGDGGAVITPIGTASDLASSMVIQGDGKIIVVGSRLAAGGGGAAFAVARYLPDGALDSSFNGTGKVVTSIGGVSDFASGVALQTDGKILVAGH
ncbi:MAG: choice-of-anchor D domain-containing protein, partial [Roseimicrobium sp.]